MHLLQQTYRSGLLLLGTLTCSTFAYCRIFSIPDIARLTDSSSVIVVGDVLSVVQIGKGEIPMPDGKPYTCASMTAFIRVDEVLKGEVTNSTIQVDYLQNPNWERGPLTNSLTEGTHLMFFLKPDGEKFAFVAPERSSMQMSRWRNALLYSSGEDVYTQVLWHLGRGLFDEQASSQDRIQTIFGIDFEQTPAVQNLFKEALESPAARSDLAFRSELLAALVRHKDESVLPDLETALLTNHDVALNNARCNMIYALQQIDASLSGPILIQALKLPEAELRVAAAAALGTVHSKDAVAALFAALDDPEIEVRGRAINSLTGIFHAPQCLPTGYAPADSFQACVEEWKELAATQTFTPIK